MGYDSLGRLLWKEDPYGNRKSWKHDNQSRNITDPLGREEIEQDNAFDLIEEKQLLENNQTYSKTEYSYDGTGNLIQQAGYGHGKWKTLRIVHYK